MGGNTRMLDGSKCISPPVQLIPIGGSMVLRDQGDPAAKVSSTPGIAWTHWLRPFGAAPV